MSFFLHLHLISKSWQKRTRAGNMYFGVTQNFVELILPTKQIGWQPLTSLNLREIEYKKRSFHSVSWIKFVKLTSTWHAQKVLINICDDILKY